jgi:hypothetical protein
MIDEKNLNICVYDLIFYLVDDDGNEIENKNKTTKLFRLKDNIRFKPLEYITEDLDLDMIEEIKIKKGQ